MKQLLLSISTCLIGFASFAQFGELDNGTFEDWTDSVLFENPDGWQTGNWQTENMLTTTLKDNDAQNGNYSVLLETHIIGEDSLFGFVLNGSFDSIPDGGFAYTDVVDTLKGWYKFDIQPGDSGTILLVMFNADTATEMLVELFTGTQNTWTEFSLPFNAGLIAPDSMLIAFTSSNAFAEEAVDGSWAMFDNISFASSAIFNPAPVPNGDFENWTEVSAETPDDWWTWNQLFAAYNAVSVEKITDSYEGTYAAQITTLQWGPDDTIPGLLTNGWVSEGVLEGGVPYVYEPTTFSGYYKYEPQGTDTGFISVEFYENGNTVASAAEQIIAQTTSYTNFSLPITFTNQPDSMRVTVWSGENPDTELKVDSLALSGGNVAVKELLFGSTKLSTFPNPATDIVTVAFKLVEASTVSLHVMDMQGRLVMNKSYGTLPVGAQNIQLDIKGLKKGTYFINLKGNKESIAKKLVVE